MSWEPAALSGRARVAAVIGWPVAHSLSPRLHGYWLRHHRIDGAYVPLAVHPDHIAAALAALPKLGFAGANVTLPHKVAALTAAARVSRRAARIGAANTLVVATDGCIEADNTDAFGFLAHLAASLPAWRAAAAPAVVVGAGGAARAIVDALVEAGCREVRVVNRTDARAEALAAAFGPPVRPLPWRERAASQAGAGLLVNTTTQGMAGQPPLDLDLAHLPVAAAVADIVYTPLETPLLARARGRGHPVVDGIGMLLHQARPGFAAWFGIEPAVTPALRAFVLAGLT
jgi:shikimate dehydrogenase